MFIEGDDWEARDAFSTIADITGGALLKFDESAPEKIAELLKAISVFAVGGVKLLSTRREELPGAKLLLNSLK